jgi:hypothetical protein
MAGDPRTMMSNRVGGSSRVIAAMAGIVVVAAVLGGAVGFTSRPPSPTPHRVPTSPTSATLRAAELYQQALNTIAAAVGFHYVAIFAGTETIVGDAGRAVGRQVVTFKSTYGLEAFELLIDSNGTLYFQGNAAAVEDQLGVPAPKTSNVENRWVSLSHSDGPYSELAAGMTVADQGVFVPMIPISTATVRVDGRTATQISGTVTGADDPVSTALLDIDTSSHAPLAYSSITASTGASATSTVTFTAWGQAVSLNPPEVAIAWSTVGASTPPDGYGGG